MKSLADKINEGFFKNVGAARPKPKTKRELQELIDEAITSNGYNCDLNFIDTSLITDMSLLFLKYFEFNGDISKWDVSNVKDMNNLFSYTNFNGDISKWDTSNVENMRAMFQSDYAFNGDISKWDTSKVKDMSNMFTGARSFNQDISKWDTSNVVNMKFMFTNATSFNQDISNWDIKKVKTMDYMFYDAKSFNQDISNWDLLGKNKNEMFFGCKINKAFKPKGIK